MASAMPLSAQPRCFVYVDDFGSEQDNRIRSLGKEIQAQQSELRLMEKMTKDHKYDRDVILARVHRKMAIFQLTIPMASRRVIKMEVSSILLM